MAFGTEAEAVEYAKANGIALGDNLERRGVGATIVDASLPSDGDNDFDGLNKSIKAIKASIANLGSNLETVNTHFAGEITAIKARLDAIEDAVKLLNKAAAAK